MIPRDKILLIQRLLGEGLAQREIVEQIGVSRGTISRVSQGLLEPGEAHKETAWPRMLAESIRCPKCGSMIETDPCLACYVEEYPADEKPGKKVARRRATKRTDEDGDPLRIRLRPEHRARYERIRRDVEAGIRMGDPTETPTPLDLRLDPDHDAPRQQRSPDTVDSSFPHDARTDPRRPVVATERGGRSCYR